jgi:hypothetical protein
MSTAHTSGPELQRCGAVRRAYSLFEAFSRLAVAGVVVTPRHLFLRPTSSPYRLRWLSALDVIIGNGSFRPL